MFRDRFSLRTWKLCSTEKRKLARGLPLEIWVGGFSNSFGIFTPNLGEDEPSLTSIFFRWVGEKSPTRNYCIYFQDGCIIQSHAPPTRGFFPHQESVNLPEFKVVDAVKGWFLSVQTWWERVTTDATQWCKVLPRLQLHMG